MPRLSQGLDVGAELERDRELRRKIAEARDGKLMEEEEAIEIAPKFAQEIDELVEDDTPVVAKSVDDDDGTVIPLKRITEKRAKAEAKSEAKAAKKAPAKKEIKIVRVETKKPKEQKPEKKVEKAVAPAAQPKAALPKAAPPATPAITAPADAPEDDGVGRLVLALLLVSIIAVVLIYAGLSQQPAQAQQQPGYARFASDNNITLTSLDNAEGAKLYWFKRALAADNEGEAAAVMRMVLCNQPLTQDSSPLNYTKCPVNNTAFVVRESDVANLSKPSKCDSLEDVITCDNGYIIDGIVAFKDGIKPAAFVAKSLGQYTVVTGGTDSLPEVLIVVSDVNGNYVAYTTPLLAAKDSMALKFFVGDAFLRFNRLYLDHANTPRAVVYQLV
jgi:hypothetical protein